MSKVLDLILIADDTNIFYSHKDSNSLTQIISGELTKLSDWFKVNKLSINIKKSNFIIFKSRQKTQNLDFDF